MPQPRVNARSATDVQGYELVASRAECDTAARITRSAHTWVQKHHSAYDSGKPVRHGQRTHGEGRRTGTAGAGTASRLLRDGRRPEVGRAGRAYALTAQGEHRDAADVPGDRADDPEAAGRGHRGTKVVNRIATALRTEFPNQRGFSRTSLHYMQQMARTWPGSIVQQAVGQLPWGHVVTLMDKCTTRFELDLYAQHAVHRGWSRDRLTTHIRSELHLARGAAANNFDVTIPDQSEAATQIFRLHRFVVIELKTTKAHPSHLGQLSFCVGAVDRFLRDPERDDQTLGILIAESQDETTVEFALQLQNQPLAVSTYAALPSRVRELMPSSDDLSRIAREALHPTPERSGGKSTPVRPTAAPRHTPTPTPPPYARTHDD